MMDAAQLTRNKLQLSYPTTSHHLDNSKHVSLFSGGLLGCKTSSIRYPSLGGRSASSHDSEQGVDVVALDGVPAAGDDLVLGFSH